MFHIEQSEMNGPVRREKEKINCEMAAVKGRAA